jgi:SAM-dependent methyltransferase
MDRLATLREGIGKHHEVLEIGPYFNPIAPRREGYRVTTIDVFDAEELRRRAVADPNLGPSYVDRIEAVDLIGSACDLADLTVARYGPDRRFDWILSSHNFEHLPDPIRFLRQCASVLGPLGTLRMAVPDKRFCFDHFRQVSDVSEWLQAYHERRTKPTVYQVFREEAYRSTAGEDGRWTPTRQTLAFYRAWFGPNGQVPDAYMDTHCWAFTPASFELLLHDLQAFGLVPLQIDCISEPKGLEFFVDVRQAVANETFSEDDYFSRRESLLRRCLEAESPCHAVRPAVAPRPRGIPGKVIREAVRVARQVAALGARLRQSP